MKDKTISLRIKNRLIKKIIFILFLLQLSPAFLQVDHLDVALSDAVFQNYTMKNGLSANYCYDIQQDHKGNIWIATLNGLSKFNGTTWEIFQQQNKDPHTSLSSNWIINLQNDSKHLYINSINGISRFELSPKKMHHFKSPVKGWGKILKVGTMLYISSWTGIDLYEERNASLHFKKHFSGSENNTINHLFQDSQQRIWICPEDQPCLMQITPGKQAFKYFRSINFQGKQERFIINSVTEYSKDTLLLNTRDKGILKYHPKSNTAIVFLNDPELQNLNVSSSLLYRLSGSTFLILGTKGRGLIFIDLKNKHLFQNSFDFNHPSGLLSNDINALLLDRNYGIWVATTGGVSYFHPSIQNDKYYFFHNNPLLKQSTLINCVEMLHENEFLIGTDSDGLLLHHAGKIHTEKITFPSKQIHQITCMLKLNQDAVLVGTNKGVYRYSCSKKRMEQFELSGKFQTELVLNIKRLNKQWLAICSYTGVLIYDLEKRSVVFSELEKAQQKAFCKDAYLHGNELYLLRFFDGCEKINLRTGHRESLKIPGLKSASVNYVNFAADDHNVFIGTSSGIIQVDLKNSKNVRLLTNKHGLSGDMIENICLSRHKHLIYTTTIGLYAYDLDKQKSTLLKSYENYVQKWFNQLKITDGIVVYSVSNYFMLHDTNFKFKHTQTPALDIEQLRINGKKIKDPKQLDDLSYRQNNLQIKLAALVYPGAEENKWNYRLLPLDSDFKTCKNGLIELLNLPPDAYTLEIYSVNNQGVRSSETRSISLNIHPPFYATWWFFILLLVAMFLAYAIFFRYKKKQLEQLNSIRNQISRDLHDELGASVSSINIMSKMLLKKGNQDEQVIRNISKYSVEISNTINDIIWNINPKFDTLNELLLKMTRSASDILEATEIRYEIDLPDSKKLESNIPIRNELKYHLFLIFKEALNNVVKHSETQELKISFELERSHFSFRIKDSGNGFDLEKNSKGNGLHNMQARALEIAAELTIASKPGEGTEIILNIKLK